MLTPTEGVGLMLRINLWNIYTNIEIILIVLTGSF